jgi:CBS domain-containing protein
MKVRDIMTTDVVTLAPDTPVPQIARTFRELGISGAPVVENGEIIGIVTEVDLIARHARPHSPYYLPLLDARIPLGGQREYNEIIRRVLGLTARDIMTENVKTITADAEVEDLATLMVEEKANPVPVLDAGRLVGIISHTDLIQHLEEAGAAAEGEGAAA